jgi:vacuolar-type H+-ATPase subunit I/STV1
MKIEESKLQQIIKEEAIRLKKKMMLESERDSILKQLQEMEDVEIEEGELGEGWFSTDWGKKADEMLALPNYSNALVSVVSKYMQNPQVLGKWGQDAIAGKNLQDPAERKQAFQALLQAYKNLWKAEYIKNGGNMVNTKLDPATGQFEKSSISLGNITEKKEK